MIKRTLFVAMLAAHPALAQVGFNAAGEPCAPVTDLLAAAERAGEHKIFEGHTKDNYKFIITSDGHGAWTLLMVSNRNGSGGGLVPQACIKASDQDQIEGTQS